MSVDDFNPQTLKELYDTTTQGTWKQGRSSHETVVGDGSNQRKVAEFTHADDASFCDYVHKHTPHIISMFMSTEKYDTPEGRHDNISFARFTNGIYCQSSDKATRCQFMQAVGNGKAHQCGVLGGFLESDGLVKRNSRCLRFPSVPATDTITLEAAK